MLYQTMKNDECEDYTKGAANRKQSRFMRRFIIAQCCKRLQNVMNFYVKTNLRMVWSDMRLFE